MAPHHSFGFWGLMTFNNDCSSEGDEKKQGPLYELFWQSGEHMSWGLILFGHMKKNTAGRDGEKMWLEILLSIQTNRTETIDMRTLWKFSSHLVPFVSEQTNLNYFENPDLKISRWYKNALDLYRSKTGNSEIPLSYTAFGDYFNHWLWVNSHFVCHSLTYAIFVMKSTFSQKQWRFHCDKKWVTEYQKI